MRRFAAALAVLCCLFLIQACRKASVEEAKAFLDKTEAELLALWTEASRANWIQATYITGDSEILAAKSNERVIAATVRLAKESARFDGVALPPDLARKMKLLKLSLSLAAPADPKESEELTRIAAGMEGVYGKGRYCPDGVNDKSKCLDVGAITKIMAESREPAKLLDAWRGWRTISPPMRKDFERYVELANKGARELGFADTGAMWRSKYDMSPEEFAKELDRLWAQVRPLYVSLHAYVRNKLREKYGDAVVSAAGPIPAHLLGNIWAQSWENIYPLVAPPDADPGDDLARTLAARKTDHFGMVRYGEGFFTSLGFSPLPGSFWDRSLFLKPRDREVVCHASAWNIDWKDDLRLKMCIRVNDDDFVTVHHELGHNYYQRAYVHLPVLFQNGANDGFHEAIGDAVALSITPGYLKSIGLVARVPGDDRGVVNFQMKRALDKIAFLPWGKLVDQWRWDVFAGKVAPDRYNAAWWELRERFQGVAPPTARSEEDFDPGAKYHIPANVSYTRYFLAFVYQFQFHRALCQAAGFQGPLHQCSIFGSKEAGAKLEAMMRLGASRPWPEAYAAVTGTTRPDASALLEYFAPLRAWLEGQNAGRTCGW